MKRPQLRHERRLFGPAYKSSSTEQHCIPCPSGYVATRWTDRGPAAFQGPCDLHLIGSSIPQLRDAVSLFHRKMTRIRPAKHRQQLRVWFDPAVRAADRCGRHDRGFRHLGDHEAHRHPHSVIRTFDGAEVIVPNGILLSDRVTNWTLSDRRRRIDLDVGVEYGTPAHA